MVIIMTRTYSKRRLLQSSYLEGSPHVNNKSGFRGVAYIASNKKRKKVRYRAELQYDGKRYLGIYRVTPEEAYQDYRKLVIENVPKE